MTVRRNTILISGVPGVGKTTISSLLAERLGCQVVNISELAERNHLIICSDSERETSVVDLDSLEELLASIIDETEGFLIIEGHFAHEIIRPEVVIQAFVLRRAPWRLRDELEVRGYSKGKIWENIEAELVDVCLVEALKAFDSEIVCEIDTTERSPSEIVEEIASIVHGMKLCVDVRIDWLSREETKRMLEARDVHCS